MIFKKKKEVEQPEPPAGTPSAATAETLIASGIQIKGKIDGKDKVRISGYFEGDLQCDSMVSIEKMAGLTERLAPARSWLKGKSTVILTQQDTLTSNPKGA